jgi:hypothetical protein
MLDVVSVRVRDRCG